VVEEVPARAGDTQELSADEIQDAIAPQTDDDKRGSKGVIIAIVAAVALAALAVGGYFFMGSAPLQVTEDPVAPPAQGAVQPAPAPEPVPTPEPDTPPATAPQQGGESAPAASSSEPAASTAAQTAVQVAPPQAERLRIFRDPLAIGGDGPEMVMLPGGSFLMGAKFFSGDASELPQHERQVAPFAISRYEVTVDEYKQFAEATKRKMPRSSGLDVKNTPVVFVSWEDAQAYVRWLSKQTGNKYRLPSEAQWEYAARAGTESPYWWGTDVGEDNAHCFDCKTGLNPRQATRVGRFKANAFELFDTSGNVMEWTRDCFHKNYKGAPEDDSVWEGGDCDMRVTRGGAYGNTSKSLRNAARARRPSAKGNDETGIRLTRAP
jgi:formylglycine-generating enzyme required for sulfatase activity